MELLIEYGWAFIVFLVAVLGWFLRRWDTEHKEEVDALKREANALRREAVMKEELVGKTAVTDAALKSIREDLRALAVELSSNNSKLITAVHDLHIHLRDSQATNNERIYQHIDKKIADLRHDIEGMRGAIGTRLSDARRTED